MEEESKEGLKMESMNPKSHDHCSSSSIAQSYNCSSLSSSIGFMDLLGLQDFGPACFFESILSGTTSLTPWLEPPPLASSNFETITSTTAASAAATVDNNKDQSTTSEVLNLPATPNSSSISSASNEAGGATDEQHRPLDDKEGGVDQEEDEDGEEEHQQKTKKVMKHKKPNQKRQREPRIAFMTKSEVDHLEDGYRWRKYGQKAVKNSPFPRSYYRCTTSTCNVKKRLERCSNDASIVVTTYEGQHTHPSPTMARGGFSAGVLPDTAFLVSGATTFAMPMLSNSFQQQQQPYNGCLQGLSFNHIGLPSTASNAPTTAVEHKKNFCTPNCASGIFRDNGLLQDIVPSTMRKEQD